ncbi:MAG: hypothetical protein JNK89_03460, partial [Saprospiraceae bacterium]|nr:hypothetical protein [Saprospiraceae bacterium]
MPTTTSTTSWHDFYQTAAQFRDLAPWRWFYDSQIFGVQHPETGEIGWCCIMGRAGEHFALAVYRGAAGLDSFYRLAGAEELENPNNPEAFNNMVRQNCWMVSFEDAQLVSPEQKKHLKALGLSFRGAGQWIVAQSYDPGLHPWLMAEAELPWVAQCLEQAMEVARRAKNDPDLLDRENLLVRTPQRLPDGSLRWEDRYPDDSELPQAPLPEAVVPSKAFVEKVRFLPQHPGALALANFFLLSAIQENKSQRPWHPCLLLAIEPGSGMIVAQETVAYPDLPAKLEKFLLRVFKTIEGKPRQI